MEPGGVGLVHEAGDLVVLVVAFLVGFVRGALAIGEGGEAGGFEDLHHEGGAGAWEAGDDGDDLVFGGVFEGGGVWVEGGGVLRGCALW